LRFCSFSAATFLLTMLAAIAQAEPIPPEYIAFERRTCNEACTRDGASAQLCARYCDCSIEKLKAQVTFEEYTATGQSAAEDKTPPAGVPDKLAAIATSCAKATQ
jgi:uncharacterized membrane protein